MNTMQIGRSQGLLLRILKKGGGGKQVVEEYLETASVCAACISVCGLKEDPHTSMNNKTDMGCLCRTRSHVCADLNAHALIFFHSAGG